MKIKPNMGKYLKKQYCASTQRRGLVTIQNDKVLDILMKLGLTELQAKTYLTLTRFEKAEVKKISENSKIARQDLYRIIPALEKLGLVEKIIATPILYKAIPLSEGTSSLFQKKSTEYSSLKSSLEMLITDLEENSKAVADEENEAEFVITSERKRLVANLDKAYSESTSIDIVLPGNALNFMIFNFYETLSSVLARGVKIRVMANKSDMRKGTKQKLENLETHSNFELRYVETVFEFGFAICNGREVHIAISTKEVPSLWTNNRQIVRINQMMFETQWDSKAGPELICDKAIPVKIKQ
jgi:sugar-specific transcriptional regulator TrmB